MFIAVMLSLLTLNSFAGELVLSGSSNSNVEIISSEAFYGDPNNSGGYFCNDKTTPNGEITQTGRNFTIKHKFPATVTSCKHKLRSIVISYKSVRLVEGMRYKFFNMITIPASDTVRSFDINMYKVSCDISLNRLGGGCFEDFPHTIFSKGRNVIRNLDLDFGFLPALDTNQRRVISTNEFLDAGARLTLFENHNNTAGFLSLISIESIPGNSYKLEVSPGLYLVTNFKSNHNGDLIFAEVEGMATNYVNLRTTLTFSPSNHLPETKKLRLDYLCRHKRGRFVLKEEVYTNMQYRASKYHAFCN